MPSPSDLSVFVATPTTNGNFPLQTLISYLDTQEECLKLGIKIDFGFVSCSLVHHARALLTNVFLTKKDHNLIFWIDSDIEWKPADFIKILMHTLKHECVCGVYPRRTDPTGFFIKFPEGESKPNEDGLVEILGTGMGFSCIRRSVMQHLSALAPTLRYGMADNLMPRVFRCDDDGTEERGEDFAFWQDVLDAGYKIYADATITLGHVGTKVYRCPV